MARTFLIPVDLNKNELQNARIQNLSTAPSTPVEGQIYYDTDDDTIWMYAAAGWQPLGGSGALANPQTEQTFGASPDNGTALTAARSDHKHGNPTHDGSAHSAIKLSDLGGANATDLDINSHKLTNVTDPANAQDAATKAYVDSLSYGIDWKGSVRVATTADITLANEQTIDGKAVVAGNRVLVKDQGTAANNGIYVCVNGGAWTRATDADSSSEVTGGMAVWVNEGDTLADTGWVLTTNDAITLGVTSLAFTQFSGLGQVTAGAGLTKSGNTINVVADGTTGITTAADQISINRTYVPMLYTATIGNGSDTTITVTHNLNTLSVLAQCYNVSTGAMVEPDYTVTGVNALNAIFTTAPTTNQYRIVIHG